MRLATLRFWEIVGHVGYMSLADIRERIRKVRFIRRSRPASSTLFSALAAASSSCYPETFGSRNASETSYAPSPLKLQADAQRRWRDLPCGHNEAWRADQSTAAVITLGVNTPPTTTMVPPMTKTRTRRDTVAMTNFITKPPYSLLSGESAKV